MPPIRMKILLAKPISTNADEKKKKEAIRGSLLSNLETSQPEIGKPSRELTGIASSKFPNSASFKSKMVFNVGIRDAQVEKANPERKK